MFQDCLSSSDESFGWSAVPNEYNMSDDDNSPASSVVNRKLYKQNLSEQLNKQPTSLQNEDIGHQSDHSDQQYHQSSRKKKNKVKEEVLSDVNSQNDEECVTIIKYEPEETPRKKHKKKKIKSTTMEEENTEESISVKKSKKSNETFNFVLHVPIVKEEESDGSTKKKKKKKRKYSIDQQQTNDALDNFVAPAAKKRKKNMEPIDTSLEQTNEDIDNMDGHLNGSAHEINMSRRNKSKKKKINSNNENDTLEVTKLETDTTNNDFDKDSNDRKPKREKSVSSTETSPRKDNTGSGNDQQKNDFPTSSRHKNNSASSDKQQGRSTTLSENSTSDSGPEDRNINVRASAKITSRKSFPVSKADTNKKCSISERIQFEDDFQKQPDSQEELNLGDQLLRSKKIDKFMERNPVLKILNVGKTDFTLEPKDEVWILKCPKDLNHESLKNMTVSIENKTKIKVDGHTFDGVLENDSQRIAVLMPSAQENKFQVNNVQPKGILTFRKRIPKLDINEVHVSVPRETFIQLPETTKRHPLFGPNYRKFTKIPAVVMERLSNTSPKKKLKSKHKNKDGDEHDTTEEFVLGKDEESNTSSKKKKKKKKRKLSDSANDEIDVKKFKHDPEVWDSEKAIEKSLFDF